MHPISADCANALVNRGFIDRIKSSASERKMAR
jgi:hypothetical protein